MKKEEKAKIVASVKQILEDSKVICIFHYRGLNASATSQMRSSLRGDGSGVQVVKNRLMKLAIAGTDYEQLESNLTGPVALSYAQDPISLFKILTDLAKENEVVEILAGMMDGKLVELGEIKELSKLGSTDDVRAGFIGTLQSGLSNIISVFENYAAAQENNS